MVGKRSLANNGNTSPCRKVNSNPMDAKFNRIFLGLKLEKPDPALSIGKVQRGNLVQRKTFKTADFEKNPPKMGKEV